MRRARAGFTVLEMLAVVSILSVLLGIVLSAVHSVQGHSRRALARAEVRAVESALKAYLDHYGSWRRLIDNLPEDEKMAGSTDYVVCFAVGDVVGMALEGDSHAMDAEDGGDAARRMNPDALPFLEFSRHYRDKSSDGRYPVNPWGGKRQSPGTSLGALNDARYFVAIDANGNGSISLTQLGGRFPKTADGVEVPTLSRSVVVWTYNPENTKDDAIVSWIE